MVKVRILAFFLVSAILANGCGPATPPTEITPLPEHPVSIETMLSALEEFAAIEAYSGWRNSASSGESQALDWMQNQVETFSYLNEMGMELERQTFEVFMGTEIHTSDLQVSIQGETSEIPADAMRGPRDDLVTAVYFDTDGGLGDLDHDPVTVEGPSHLILSHTDLASLERGQLSGRIAVIDYALIDRSVMETAAAVERLIPLLDADPDGIVMVTNFSNQAGSSHGAFIGDLSVFNYAGRPFPPTVYFRLEDVESLGISSWQALSSMETLRITLDVDVVTPAFSGNLVAHIPGQDNHQSLIIGAHIDSPNGPGAMDDGSGSVILLEVARALNQTRVQPAVDVYLVWFGSEEIGLYGSAYFAATHQDLIDQSLGMLQVDCLISPLDGIRPNITLVSYPYPMAGSGAAPWADWIGAIGAESGQTLVSRSTPYIYSDNNVFQGFDLPNADLVYEDEAAMEAAGGFHYAAHVHDPYDTVELIESSVPDVLESMAQVVYNVVSQAGFDERQFHLSDEPGARVVMLGTYTEAVHLSPTAWIDFGMELSRHGYDVDIIPYGQTFHMEDLNDAALVVALPVIDYETRQSDPAASAEAWTAEELQVLESYVENGGTLLLLNSFNRMKFGNLALDENEDRMAVNSLAGAFGITFREGSIPGGSLTLEEGHPLTQGVTQLVMAENNGVPFTIASGQILAWAGGEPVIAITQAGSGEVIVMADAGLLSTGWGGPINQPLWQALAEYIGS